MNQQIAVEIVRKYYIMNRLNGPIRSPYIYSPYICSRLNKVHFPNP